ncbi:MAG: hypothetical protein WDZ27_06935 [Waddliaceae bacterium]
MSCRISPEEEDAAIQYVAKGTLEKLPKSPWGQTNVYLPPDLLLVIKELGQDRAVRRGCANLKATALCQELGLRHLIVPRFGLSGDYTFEQRLPVADVNLRSQTSLYASHRDCFSQAAKEFSAFLIKSHFPDILTWSHPYQTEDKIPLGRFDNLPFFLNNGQGCVGLVDLGGYKVRQQKPSELEIEECVKTAIAIFPYHLEEVCEAAGVPSKRFEALTKKTQNIFEKILIGSKVFCRSVFCRKTEEADLEKSALYYNFYFNRGGQLRVVYHQ